MSVTLFTSGTLCATNAPLINGNTTPSCSELNVKHAGEGFGSLRFIVFEIYACKLEKLLIFRKFDLLPFITGSNIDLGAKNAPPILLFAS